MKMLRQLGYLLVTAGISFGISGASAQSCDLTKTLSQMDAASAKFQSAQADFSWTQYVAAVQETEPPQTGTIYFERKSGTTIMAADIRKPKVQKINFDGNQVVLFTPDTGQKQVYSAANNKSQVETFLTLGFGGSGQDLQKNWDVTCAGTEAIGGVPTAKLELVAKQKAVRDNFSKVTIWVDPTRGISLKQVFVAPSGDTKTDLFTNIKYNKPIQPSVFQSK